MIQLDENTEDITFLSSVLRKKDQIEPYRSLWAFDFGFTKTPHYVPFPAQSRVQIPHFFQELSELFSHKYKETFEIIC